MWFTARVVDAAQLSNAAPDAVVRPLARVTDRPCARPGCPAPARATLTFRYASREAWLARLADEPTPQAYDLCAPHASRTRPPHGWELRDRRPEEDREPDVPPITPADLGGERTVAVLAAALRQVPDPIPAHGDRDRAAEVAPEPSEDEPSPVLGPDPAPAADRRRPPAPRPILAARRGEVPPGDPTPTGTPAAADW